MMNMSGETLSVPGHEPHSCGSVSFQGIQAACLGYAVDNMDDVVFLHTAGPQQAVRSLWASLAGNGALEINQTLIRFKRETSYLRFEQPLAMTRLHSLALLHPQAALIQMQPGQDCFYLLSASPEQIPLRLFYAMLNKAMSLPLAPAWTDYLWKVGTRVRFKRREESEEDEDDDEVIIRKERAIVPLKTEGCGGWRVRTATDYWMNVIEHGLLDGEIQ